jgi:hypothetical protein
MLCYTPNRRVKFRVKNRNDATASVEADELLISLICVGCTTQCIFTPIRTATRMEGARGRQQSQEQRQAP